MRFKNFSAESRWTASPLKVDGLNNEWQSDNLYSKKKPDVNYAFKNDGRNLYILFVFKNSKSLNSTEATGMAIYCSPERTKQKNKGIRFIKENIVTYEFKIPLASHALYPAGIGAGPGKTIKVYFEWGGSAKKVLKAKASWPTPKSLVSGDVYTGAGETRAQEFLSSFDAMSRPTLETKQYSFWVDVKLAPNQ
jgi:hypothetical protein